MKNDDLPVTEEELHAFVDGELPPDRREAVETWLATHPEDAARVGAWRAQSESIRARYLDVAAQPVPPRLNVDRLNRAVHSWNFIAAAAVVAAFLIGGVAGWAMRGAPATASAQNDMDILAKQAIDAHKLFVVEIRHPVEVPGVQSEHLSRWLSKRVGYPLRLPDLERLGLKLVGGRLLLSPAGEGAAQLMYETTSGQRFTIYCAKSGTPNAAMHYKAGDKTASAVYWVDGNMAYVVSGAAERSQLWEVAETAYEQMERGAPFAERDS